MCAQLIDYITSLYYTEMKKYNMTPVNLNYIASSWKTGLLNLLERKLLFNNRVMTVTIPF